MSTIRVTNLRDVNGNNGIVLNSGAVSVPGTLAVTGASTFTGTATVGNLVVNGTISGTNNQYLPTQSGNSGRYLTTDGSTPSWAALSVETPDIRGLEQTSGGTRKAAACLVTVNQRYNQFYNWSSGGPWTTIYGYGANGQTDAEQFAWLTLTGSNTRNSGNYAFSEEGYSDYTRKIKWSTGRELGLQNMDHGYANSTSYGTVCMNMWPIRNFHPTSTKTINFYNQYSNYWSSGYEGSSMWYYAPATNGTYNISSGTWNRTNNQTSGNSYGYTWSSSVSIPPQTTYVLFNVSSSYYWTSFSGNYIWKTWNMWYNIDTTLSDTYIQTDYRMLQAMEKADFYRYGVTSDSSYQFYRVYNATADMYGNR